MTNHHESDHNGRDRSKSSSAISANGQAGEDRGKSNGEARNKRPLNSSSTSTTWTFLTNHSHVLLCLSQDPGARLRDVAVAVRITERATQKIVAELEEGGIIERTREGRRNHYVINYEARLRHPLEGHCTIADLLETLRDSSVSPLG